jgi:hypothetical protein
MKLLVTGGAGYPPILLLVEPVNTRGLTGYIIGRYAYYVTGEAPGGL